MLTFILYTLKSAACLSLFYLLYKLVLSKNTHFQLNRVVLLSLLTIALLAPWLTSLLPKTLEFAEGYNSQASVVLNEIIVTPVVESSSSIDFITVLLAIYFIGVLLLLIGQLIGAFRLGYFISKSTKYRQENGSILVLLNEAIAPMSWFNYILISTSDFESQGEAILLHEEAHYNYKHSLDRYFMEILLLWQWFNPMVWWFKKELEIVHEYQADDAVLRQGVDAEKYQLLLIKKTVGINRFKLANSLNRNFLKKRITMMLKEKTNRWSTLRLLVMAPCVLFIAFSLPNTLYAHSEKSDVVNAATAELNTQTTATAQVDPQKGDKNKSKEEVFMVVEEMPIYGEGTQDLLKHLAQNIRYPVKAQEAETEGRVVVSFVVDKSGDTRDFKVVRGVSEELDNEAMRVLTELPSKWKPGKQKGVAVSVQYTLPVMFRLVDKDGNGKLKEKSTEPVADNEIVVVGYGKE